MNKKVSISKKPRVASADQWVESRSSTEPAAGPEKNKRLTIDIPESLHRAIKSQCAMRGTKIADEVRELLLQKYGNTETQN